MNRDAQGRLHHAAGAPASLGGKYAPDNKRGGAAIVATPNPVARPEKTRGFLRWEKRGRYGEIVKETNGEYLDMRSVLDQMPMSEIYDHEGELPRRYVEHDLAERVFEKASQRGLIGGKPESGDYTPRFQLDQRNLQEYVDYRITNKLIDRGDPVAIAESDAEAASKIELELEDQIAQMQEQLQQIREQRVAAIARNTEHNIDHIIMDVDSEGSYDIIDRDGNMVFLGSSEEDDELQDALDSLIDDTPMGYRTFSVRQ